ncbi:MAG: insulinase family protein [Acidobacteria bacterium]|nr:insulinase family protein [Acidobacteriota bacterium]
MIGLSLCAAAGAQERWPTELPPRPLPAHSAAFPPYQLRTLPNGLQVMVVLHHEQPSVSMRLLIRAGSAADPAGKLGLATLCAAVLDQGTSTRSASDIADAIDFIGGGLGAGAGTDLSFVNMVVMKDSFQTGMALLSEVARDPAFADEEIERQKQQALSAIQVSSQDPGYIADAVFDRLVYGFHPYGLPGNGTSESIAGLTRGDLAAFHARFFVPNNAILAIVGDLTAEEAFASAQEVFGDWAPRALPPQTFTPPPEPTRRLVVIDKPDAVQTEVRIGHLGIARKHPDYMALNLATRILGGEGSNRLHQVLRTDRGLTYGAQADMDTLKDAGDIVAETNTRSEATGEVVRLMIDEMWKMQRERVSGRELENAQAYITGSFPLTIETPDAIAMQVLNLLFYGLPLDELQNFRERVDAVTVDDIQRAAREYYKPDRLSIVLVGNAAAFTSQLAGVGLPQFEVIPIETLDLTAADLRRPSPAARFGRAAPVPRPREIRADPPAPAVRAGGAAPAFRPDSSARPPAIRPAVAVRTVVEGRPAAAVRASLPAGRPQAPSSISPEEDESAGALLDRMIAAKGGLDRLRAIRTISAETTATVATPDGPIEVETRTYLEYPDRMRVETQMPAGAQVQVFDGRGGWVRDARGVFPIPEEGLEAIRATFARDAISALLAAHDGRLHPRRLPDVKDDTGALRQALELSGRGVDPFVFLVDPATGLIARQTYVAGGAGRPLIEELSSDYRAVDGVQVAFTAVVRQGGRQMLERRVTGFTLNRALAPTLFTRPGA